MGRRATCALSIVLLVCGSSFGLGVRAGPPEIQASESCGNCHRTIYESWKESAHARSLEDEIFLQAYRLTQERDGEQIGRVCLGCHAPLIELSADASRLVGMSWEGVNCEVCHSLTQIDLSGDGPRHLLEPGPVKRGPIENASAEAHGVEFSPLHKSAEACAWCHEYVNPEGTPIMTTYSEWKGSGAAKSGLTCQSCHMGLTDQEVADPKLERLPGAEVNLHHVPGGHSLDQLHKALGLAIRHDRDGDALEIGIELRNKGAGHAVPTGMPGRRVVLLLNLRTSDGGSFEESRVYGRNFIDAGKKTIVRDGDFFARGVKQLSDDRIRADERRTESFRFPVKAGATAYLEVKLRYEHQPNGGDEGMTSLVFLSEKRTLSPDDGSERP